MTTETRPMTGLQPDVRIGERYSLTRRVASGGMGDVWEATDEVLERSVAVKVLRPTTAGDPVFARRFRDEALYTANLSHPNIAAVYDYGEDNDVAFLVMELVPGEPLSHLVQREGALDADRVRSIMAQAALALDAAHDAGVVHRDVKPANILLTPEGTVKLTDFGIARALDGSGQTLTGEIVGTPHYLSPEQALGEAATGASDLYALGVVAHELLTGRRPFDKVTPVATALAQVNDPPPPLPDEVPAELRGLIERCLAKSPTDRPRSARELAELLGVPRDPATVAVPTGRAASSVRGNAAEAESAAVDALAAVADPDLATGVAETDAEVAADDPSPTPVSLTLRGPNPRRVHWAWIPASGILGILAVAAAVILIR